MPMQIHPRVTGTVHIELTSEEAKTLAHNLERVLNIELNNGMTTVGRQPEGITCFTFLTALRKVI